MTQFNKINTFLAALAVTFSLTAAAVQVAEACGSYGPPTEEQRVENLVYDTHWNAERSQGEIRTRIFVDSVDVSANRVAVVNARIASIKGDTERKVQYSLYKYEGVWKIAKNDTFKLAIASLQHALDANVQPALNQSHDTVELAAINLQGPLHAFASLLK